MVLTFHILVQVMTVQDFVFSDDGLSKCGDIPHDILQCSSQGNISVLNCTVSLTIRMKRNHIGNCMFNCFKINKTDFGYSAYHILPKNTSDLNEVICGKEFSRNGTLCGKCKDGYYPLVYSFNLTCVECPHGRSNWWKFVLSAFLPHTIFYFIVFYLLQSSLFYACTGTSYYIIFEATFNSPDILKVCWILTWNLES